MNMLKKEDYAPVEADLVDVTQAFILLNACIAVQNGPFSSSRELATRLECPSLKLLMSAIQCNKFKEPSWVTGSVWVVSIQPTRLLVWPTSPLVDGGSTSGNAGSSAPPPPRVVCSCTGGVLDQLECSSVTIPPFNIAPQFRREVCGAP